MASAPRLRMVAGPNGSGKSTLLDWLSKQDFRLGHCLNPDALERELSEGRPVDLGRLGVRIVAEDLWAFLRSHPLAPRFPRELPQLTDGRLEPPSDFLPGYYVPAICDLIRDRWIADRESFTFETVMSAPEKLDLLHAATELGYRTYLYYICAEPPELNAERIKNRVASGGHDVPSAKATARYAKSLDLLPKAVDLCDRAYVFDNSGLAHRIVAEFEDGNLKAVSSDLPNWFVENLRSKLR